MSYESAVDEGLPLPSIEEQEYREAFWADYRERHQELRKELRQHGDNSWL